VKRAGRAVQAPIPTVLAPARPNAISPMAAPTPAPRSPIHGCGAAPWQSRPMSASMPTTTSTATTRRCRSCRCCCRPSSCRAGRHASPEAWAWPRPAAQESRSAARSAASAPTSTAYGPGIRRDDSRKDLHRW